MSDISEKLLPVAELITDKSKNYPLNLKNITDFLLATHGNRNVVEEAHKYTNDLSALVSMLRDIQDNVLD